MGLFEQFFGASSALTEQPRERRLLVSSLSRGEGIFVRRVRKKLSRATDQLQDIRYRSMGELARPLTPRALHDTDRFIRREPSPRPTKRRVLTGISRPWVTRRCIMQ
jgi:hypothetical protein